MTTKYKVVSWEFDSAAFSAALQSQMEMNELKDYAEIFGVDANTLYSWWKGSYGQHGAFQHPRMSNFIKVCNHLDLDPREYFCLAEMD